MVEKNEIYTIKITDMGSEGEGIGRIEGMTVFVPDTIVGDEAQIEITQVKKNFARGQLLSIEIPSVARIEPECMYAGECGGCALQAMRYEDQLKLKRKFVRDKLARIGGLEDAEVRSVRGMKAPLRYRNKAQFAIGAGAIKVRNDGSLANENPASIGFYKKRSHDIVDCRKCLIQTEVSEVVADVMREYIKSDKVSVYDEKSGRGLLRHIVVKTAFKTGEVMVIIVMNGSKLPNTEKLVSKLSSAVEAVKPKLADQEKYVLRSVVINVNKKKTSEILGLECKTIFGPDVITDYVGTMKFEISPLSFYQVNPEQMKKLYSIVAEYSGLTGEETVVDLYCGVGTIGLSLASRAKYVWGIESEKGAVIDANRNAVINGIVNAQFIAGDAEDELPKLAEQGISPDLIILDPPRSGCEQELLAAVVDAAPARIIYVSCDPATLARDLKILCGPDGDYRFIEAQPVDMFPYTLHVETVVLMSRKEK